MACCSKASVQMTTVEQQPTACTICPHVPSVTGMYKCALANVVNSVYTHRYLTAVLLSPSCCRSNIGSDL